MMKKALRITCLAAAGILLLLIVFAFDATVRIQTSTGSGETEQQNALGSTEFTVYELPFDSGDLHIFGQVYLPEDGSDIHPVVILSHGFQARYYYNEDYAKALAASGIAVYLFDFPGGSMESASGGSMSEMSVLTERTALEAVIGFIEVQDFTDTNNLFLCGESQGGLVTAITAPEFQDQINGMILMYPAFNIVENARSPLISSSMVPDTMTVDGADISRKYYDDAKTVELRPLIEDFSKDVLILQGDRDSLVSPATTKAAANLYPSAEYRIISGAGHGFSGSEKTEAINEIIQFIQSHLK